MINCAIFSGSYATIIEFNLFRARKKYYYSVRRLPWSPDFFLRKSGCSVLSLKVSVSVRPLKRPAVVSLVCNPGVYKAFDAVLYGSYGVQQIVSAAGKGYYAVLQ